MSGLSEILETQLAIGNRYSGSNSKYIFLCELSHTSLFGYSNQAVIPPSANSRTGLRSRSTNLTAPGTFSVVPTISNKMGRVSETARMFIHSLGWY